MLTGRMLLLASTLTWAALAVLCQAASTREHSDQRYRVVCVYVAQSFYRLGHGKFTVEDIDPKLCTHLIYGFAGVHNSLVRPLDGYLDLESNYGEGNYKKFNELRKGNPQLTTLLDVGGKGEGAIKFSELAKDESKRKDFVLSCLRMVKNHDFDGINLDWQYPAHKGGEPEDREHFTELLQELRSAFDNEGGYVLTTTLGVQKDLIDQAYEIEKVSKIVDFMMVLTYDYKHSYEKTTGLTSQLYTGAEGDSQDNADFTLQYLLKNGAAPEKLVMSVSCYGETWTLASGAGPKAPPGSKASGPGETWTYTKEAGTIGYNEFCESQKEVDWSVTWLDTEKAAYATTADQWISFDNVQSVTEKSQYVVQNQLGGLLLHGIESDDGKGLCSDQKFPLLRAANTVLRDVGSTTTTTQSTTTQATNNDLVCPHPGYFRHPRNCAKYYQCVHSGNFSKIVFDCPPGTLFSEKSGLCDWAHKVTDCK